MDLVKFRQSLTTSPPMGSAPLPPAPTGLTALGADDDTSEPDPNPSEDLLRLVDEVTREEERNPKNVNGSFYGTNAHGGSFAGGVSSTTSGSLFGVPSCISPGSSAQSPPPPPPRYSATTAVYNSPDRDMPPRMTDHGAAHAHDMSSSDPPGAAPLFPKVAGSEDPQTRGRGGTSPPVPPPPSFEVAMASMRDGNSPHQMPAPPPPPPIPGSRMPETLIVRNDQGVFLLQPQAGTSPSGVSPVMSSSGPPSSIPGSSPPCYGAAHAVSPPQAPPAYGESPLGGGASMLPPPYGMPPSPQPVGATATATTTGGDSASAPPPYELSLPPPMRPIGE